MQVPKSFHNGQSNLTKLSKSAGQRMFIHPGPKVDTRKIFQQNAEFVADLDRT
jgi:hypothetical protein